jgi:Fe-S oxidoreductase
LGIVARPREKEATLETHFVFAADGGSFEHATERCVGVGACRKTEGGVMCPSYRATGEEQYSTRGRARLLWEMLAGALREEGFKSKAVQQSLDLCLSCKACKSECPVQVDMAAYKSEYLAQRYKHRLHPLHHYIFGFADKLARLGSLTPALTNWLLTSPITSPLIKRIVGVAQERQLPSLAAKSYTKARAAVSETNDASRTAVKDTGFSPYIKPDHAAGVSAPEKKLRAPSFRLFSGARVGDLKSHPASAPRPEGQLAPPQVAEGRMAAPQVPALQVVLWPDTWNNYYHPETLAAAESLLTEAGFTVTVPKGHICCGRPLYDFGLLDSARSYLARVLDRMAPQIEAGLPFIFLEPSCASVFKDELLELFPNDARAQRMSRQVWLLADFLAAQAPNFAAGRLAGAQILLHGHCHHKAVFGGPANEIALLRQAGATVEAIQAGCCGMAGPFGFEADKFEVSKAIANDGLLPAVDSASPATLIVADGFSCREQISQLGHREARHFAEVLARDPGCGK